MEHNQNPPENGLLRMLAKFVYVRIYLKSNEKEDGGKEK